MQEQIVVSVRRGNIKMGDIIGNLLLFLVLPPIIGLPVAFYNIVKLRNPSKSQYYTFFFVIAAYLGVLNATKTLVATNITI